MTDPASCTRCGAIVPAGEIATRYGRPTGSCKPCEVERRRVRHVVQVAESKRPSARAACGHSEGVGHNCAYVDAVNALIPKALEITGPNPSTRAFAAAMQALAVSVGLRPTKVSIETWAAERARTRPRDDDQGNDRDDWS